MSTSKTGLTELEFDMIIIGAALSTDTYLTIERIEPLDFEINTKKCYHSHNVEDLDLGRQIAS